jgi:hypothetical protein
VEEHTGQTRQARADTHAADGAERRGLRRDGTRKDKGSGGCAVQRLVNPTAGQANSTNAREMCDRVRVASSLLS